MKAQIPWFRVFVEGAVIVVSILLAFGIEAAWNERNQTIELRLELQNVAEELRSIGTGCCSNLTLPNESLPPGR